jgi:hypothetical protein
MLNATVRANARTLPKEDEWSDTFGRAYARWHRALAQLEHPDSNDEAFVTATFTEEREAIRGLFFTPANNPEIIWAKLAAFEHDLVLERIVGERVDSVILLGFGAIKADLMNLGIGGDL